MKDELRFIPSYCFYSEADVSGLALQDIMIYETEGFGVVKITAVNSPLCMARRYIIHSLIILL